MRVFVPTRGPLVKPGAKSAKSAHAQLVSEQLGYALSCCKSSGEIR